MLKITKTRCLTFWQSNANGTQAHSVAFKQRQSFVLYVVNLIGSAELSMTFMIKLLFQALLMVIDKNSDLDPSLSYPSPEATPS